MCAKRQRRLIDVFFCGMQEEAAGKGVRKIREIDFEETVTMCGESAEVRSVYESMKVIFEVDGGAARDLTIDFLTHQSDKDSAVDMGEKAKDVLEFAA